MRNGERASAKIEWALASASAFLCLLTVVWKDWIELVFRVDPDHRSGSVEWAIAATLLAISVAFALRGLSKISKEQPDAV